MVKQRHKAKPFRALCMALLALAIGLLSMFYGAQQMAASWADVMVPVSEQPPSF